MVSELELMKIAVLWVYFKVTCIKQTSILAIVIMIVIYTVIFLLGAPPTRRYSLFIEVRLPPTKNMPATTSHHEISVSSCFWKLYVDTKDVEKFKSKQIHSNHVKWIITNKGIEGLAIIHLFNLMNMITFPCHSPSESILVKGRKNPVTDLPWMFLHWVVLSRWP